MISNVEPELFEKVEEALKEVIDPELGVNIVDLGLVYEVDRDKDTGQIVLYMTLTSVGCPLSEMIEKNVRECIEGIVSDFRIHWVWTPPWSPALLSEDGREMLRSLGFST